MVLRLAMDVAKDGDIAGMESAPIVGHRDNHRSKDRNHPSRCRC